jgi:hypothetical protein
MRRRLTRRATVGIEARRRVGHDADGERVVLRLRPLRERCRPAWVSGRWPRHGALAWRSARPALGAGRRSIRRIQLPRRWLDDQICSMTASCAQKRTERVLQRGFILAFPFVGGWLARERRARAGPSLLISEAPAPPSSTVVCRPLSSTGPFELLTPRLAVRGSLGRAGMTSAALGAEAVDAANYYKKIRSR